LNINSLSFFCLESLLEMKRWKILRKRFKWEVYMTLSIISAYTNWISYLLTRHSMRYLSSTSSKHVKKGFTQTLTLRSSLPTT
jgi:hypothetical protein